jgi:hypothetical protein
MITPESLFNYLWENLSEKKTQRNKRNLEQFSEVMCEWMPMRFGEGSEYTDKLLPFSDLVDDFYDCLLEKYESSYIMKKEFMNALQFYCKNAPHIIELNPVELKNIQGRIIRSFLDVHPHFRPCDCVYVRTQEKLNDSKTNVHKPVRAISGITSSSAALELLEAVYHGSDTNADATQAYYRLCELLKLLMPNC